MLQRGGSVIVAAIDLDRFKQINDNVDASVALRSAKTNGRNKVALSH